jgi:hypothetical protein
MTEVNEPARSSGIRLTKVIAAISGVLTPGIAAVIFFGRYSDWSAERNARAFCEAIPIGSSIFSTIAKAKDENVSWGSASGWWAPTSGTTGNIFLWLGQIQESCQRLSRSLSLP